MAKINEYDSLPLGYCSTEATELKVFITTSPYLRALTSTSSAGLGRITVSFSAKEICAMAITSRKNLF